MRIAACARVLDDAEIQLIHLAMLRIVSEVGMNIQSDVILD